MKSTPPQLDAPSVVFGITQEDFNPITGALLTIPGLALVGDAKHNTVVYAFEFTDEERERVAAGADLYLSLVTYGGPPQPCLVIIGKEAAMHFFGVGLTP